MGTLHGGFIFKNLLLHLLANECDQSSISANTYRGDYQEEGKGVPDPSDFGNYVFHSQKKGIRPVNFWEHGP